MHSLVECQRIFWIATTFLMTALSLNACSGYDKSSSRDKYIIQVKHQPMPPVPNFKPYRSITYSADNLRDPFAPLSDEMAQSYGNGQRIVGPLEMFSLDALRMVGTIVVNDKIWALMATPDGSVYRVGVGDYLGPHEGQVIAVTVQSVQLIEKRHENQLAGQTRPVIFIKLIGEGK